MDPRQQATMYPSMNPATRIGVVGGGPSGLAAAFALVKMGYKNVTVLECQSQVGGMCGSHIVEGRVYDLGGQVIARESSPTLEGIMNELGVELEPMGHHTIYQIDCKTKKIEEMKVVADCLALLPTTSKLQEKARATGNLGVHAVSSLAHQVAPEYLKSTGFEKSVPRVVAALFIGSGYGYPQDLPYAYLHEFIRSSLGQAWRVKGGYSSFWQKVANSLPDVRCNTQVTGIRRSDDLVQVSIVDSSTSIEKTVEFDKIIISGALSIPKGNRIYRSSSSAIASIPEDVKERGILDYTGEELELFSKVETMDYYTTVMKISGFNIPAAFYYPDHADDPSSIGRFVTVQRYYADTDIFLFWSYGTAEISQSRVTELLYEDVQKMGGHVEEFILQRKWRYFPHVQSSDMKAGFYDRLSELQGKRNTFHTGALSAFELTERNSTFSIALVNKYFGSASETIFVKRLIEYPLPNGAESVEAHYKPKILTELPGLEFPDLPTIDAYVSFYAKHPVTKDKVVFTWLDNQGKETKKLTYSQLDARVSIIAHHLLSSKTKPLLKPGDRVVLLHPPGLDFIEAFLGCLRARIIAVPLIPPDTTTSSGTQALEKLVNVVQITSAKAILSTRTYHNVVRASSLPQFLKRSKLQWPDLPWIDTNCIMDEPSRGSVSFERKIYQGSMPAAHDGHSVKEVADASFSLCQGVTKTITDPEGQDSKCTNTGSRVNTTQVSGFCLPDFPADLHEVCFLQFTSGSTGDAKGVMITHGALIHNVKSMRAAYKSTSRSIVVSWLPQYHDMGLIGGLLVSMVTGGSLIIYSPITFIRNPLMWLETVEKYKATHTAAPNFGFELVLKRFQMLKAAGRAKKLDLSSLSFLMVGAEPISAKTMKSFVEEFWDAGVREQIFAPGFGMAENCVFICCAFGRNRPMLVDSHGRVGCGYTDKSRGTGIYLGCDPYSRKVPNEFKDSCSDVRIVNPETLVEVGDGVEGEIWVSSPSNGVGYWGLPEVSKEAFGVHLSGASKDDEGIMFMRSGDLGRVVQGHLFVTGRIKDLIIVNGRNYYPSDIEKTVENLSPYLRPGCSAAFSAPAKVLLSKGIPVADLNCDEAGIVVVVEVKDESKLKKDTAKVLISQIKSVIAEQHGVQVTIVSLLLPRTIPKTTSGKIRRRECLKRFSDDTLSTVKGSASLTVSRAQARLLGSHARQQQQASSQKNFERQVASSRSKTKEEITAFLVQLLAELTGFPSSRISVTESFENYSIDSKGTVASASRLSEFLNIHISAIQIYTTGCIAELVDFCYEEVNKAAPKGPSSVTNSVSTQAVSSTGRNISPAKIQDPMNYKLDNEEISEQISEEISEQISEEQLDMALEPSMTRRTLITVLQILGVAYIGAVLILPALYIYEKLIQLISPNQASSSVVSLVFLTTGVVPLAWIVYMAITGLLLNLFGAKLLLPMNYNSMTTGIPLWSFSYVRWWTMYRLQDFASMSLAGHLRGTVFLPHWYRLLGAKIGDDVYLDSVNITDPSLLSIGSGSVIGEGATLQSHEVNAGVIRFQNVKIGKGCQVGPYSVLQRGSVMDPGSRIGTLGKTDVGERVYSVTGYSPSQVSGAPTFQLAIGQLFGLYLVGLTSAVAASVAYTAFLWLTSTFDFMQIVVDVALTKAISEHVNNGYLVIPLAMTFPRYLLILAPLMMFPEPAMLAQLLEHIAREGRLLPLLFSSAAAFLVFGAALAGLTCILKWTLTQRVQAGREGKNDRYLGSNYRRWLVHALLRSAHEKFIFLLMGTEPLCLYLRSLGAKIGRMVSIRRVNAVVDPDLLDLGDECHLGDFSKIITSQNIVGGSISSGAVKIGSRCVVGAQSVVMPLSTLQKQSVLGAMSVAPFGAVLEEGGVYVGIKAPVKIYQGQKGVSPRVPNANDGGAKTNEFEDEDRHPLLAGVTQLDPRFRQIIASLAAEFVKKTPPGHSRVLHKLGVCGRGTLRVLDNLHPGFPAHDILGPGATYPVVFRCSNAVSRDDDRCTETKGGTLRILRPETPNDLESPLLDLFMKTGDIFHARNMVEFLSYYIMTDEERADRIKKFPALGESQWGNLRKPNSFAEIHYFASTTRLFVNLASEKMYVKFKIRPENPRFGVDEGCVERGDGLPPLSGVIPALDSDTRSKSHLRDDFKSRLESPEGVRFVLQVQLHPIPATPKEQEDIQDPTKAWDEDHFPYMDVADIWLTEYVEDTLFDDIHFNPKYGPPSLAMIKATSAMQVASIDTGRSIMHDLLGYLRSGRPLPPLWYDLIKKSLPTASVTDDLVGPGCPIMSQQRKTAPVTEGNKDAQNLITAGPGCPIMSQNSQFAKSLLSLQHSNQDQTSSIIIDTGRDVEKLKKMSSGSGENLEERDPTLLRCIQPLLHVAAPVGILILALYPSLLALALIGSKAGKQWMNGLVPLAYLCTGLAFAVLSIFSKWAFWWNIKNVETHELWSITTLSQTIWACINMTLASIFMELGKGSILSTCYLKALGASIKDTAVYVDTLHALNPDQLRIGSRSAIGRNVLLFGHLYEGERVAFKSNTIGDDTYIGTRALVLPGLTMENGSELPALGLGMKDEIIRPQF